MLANVCSLARGYAEGPSRRTLIGSARETGECYQVGRALSELPPPQTARGLRQDLRLGSTSARLARVASSTRPWARVLTSCSLVTRPAQPRPLSGASRDSRREEQRSEMCARMCRKTLSPNMNRLFEQSTRHPRPEVRSPLTHASCQALAWRRSTRISREAQES